MLCCIICDTLCKFVETNQGTLGGIANRRDTACCQWFVRTVSTATSRERRNRERARTEKKREGRVWYALRAAGSHTTGPKERTPGPRRFLHHARRAPRECGDTPKRRSIVQVTKKCGDIFSLSCNPPCLSFPPASRVTRRCILHLPVFAHVHPLPTRACGCVYNNINAVKCKSCKGRGRGTRHDCNHPRGDRIKRAISERRENKEDRFARAEVSTNRPRFRIKNVQFMRSR